MDDKISVAKGFTYLGAHTDTDSNCRSGTLEGRWTKAITQLKKLRRLPATFQAKVKAIHGKVYVAAFYGVEAAEVAPQKVATMTKSI